MASLIAMQIMRQKVTIGRSVMAQSSLDFESTEWLIINRYVE
jgi:hypothetical protein